MVAASDVFGLPNQPLWFPNHVFRLPNHPFWFATKTFSGFRITAWLPKRPGFRIFPFLVSELSVYSDDWQFKPSAFGDYPDPVQDALGPEGGGLKRGHLSSRVHEV